MRAKTMAISDETLVREVFHEGESEKHHSGYLKYLYLDLLINRQAKFKSVLVQRRGGPHAEQALCRSVDQCLKFLDRYEKIVKRRGIIDCEIFYTCRDREEHILPQKTKVITRALLIKKLREYFGE